MARTTLLLVGFPKAGSTALFELLSQHPAMAAAVQKENLTLYPSIWAGRSAAPTEVDAFLASVPDVPGRVGFEAAPGNVYALPGTIDRLASAAGPGLRVLAVTRDRRRRLVSAHRFQRRRGMAPPAFSAFVKANLRGHAGGVRLGPGATAGLHVTSGLYGHWLAPWAERLGAQLATLQDTALRPPDADATMGRVARWVGIEAWDGWQASTWNVTRPRRRDRVRDRLGLATDRLPPRLEHQLAALHDEDDRRLRTLALTDLSSPADGSGS